MNPTTLRKIDLDTWFELIKMVIEGTLKVSFLNFLTNENISCNDLVQEDWDMQEASTRALSALQLFEKNCGDTFEWSQLEEWTNTYRNTEYDLLADVKSMRKYDNVSGLDGLELV